MQPTELQALLEAATHRGSSYPWWAFVLGLIGSGIGAYLASYLKKRGEDSAAQENFAAIRAQLQTTTRDTEQIRQYLSGEAWRQQQQWSTRERYYSSLLTQLQTFRLALSELGDYYREPGSEHTPDSQQGEYFPKLLTVAHESHKEIQKLLGPAALYLSAETVQVLADLAAKYWNVANFSSCTTDYASESHALVENVYGRVLFEAKKHLHLAPSDA
jgi:type II secretory pathway pseudopilin PulG